MRKKEEEQRVLEEQQFEVNQEVDEKGEVRGQSGRESEDGGGAKDRGEAECGKEHKLKVQAEQMMNKAEELQI